jgi:hypothetical protein
MKNSSACRADVALQGRNKKVPRVLPVGFHSHEIKSSLEQEKNTQFEFLSSLISVGIAFLSVVVSTCGREC